jgi:hypothetical protein
MSLPEGFNEWEHLQDQIRIEHNKRARKWFTGVDDDSIATPRASIKHACLIKDDDTAVMTLIRLWLFEVFVGHAQNFHPPLYTIPSLAFQDHAKHKPQISLYFKEDRDDVDPGESPVTGEISIRLTNETESSLTNAEVTSYANKIKSLFGSANGFLWRKGKYNFSYTDTEKGYRLNILATTETEAKRVIEQILDIQSHSPDWDNLNKNEAVNASTKYPITPPKKTILGKSRKMPRRRPVATVRFQYALMHLYGLPNPIVLVDRTFKYRDPVAPR